MHPSSSIAFFTLLYLLFSSFVYASLPNCAQVYERKEWRSLTTSEKQDYINAAVALEKRPSVFELRSIWADFAEIHEYLADVVHGVPSRGAFLPWHRFFLAAYEYQLRLINPNVTLPFWDTGLDAESIADSEVIKDFGGLSTGQGGCITQGPFARARPDGSCLRRNPWPEALHSWEEIAAGQETSRYMTYATSSETIHNIVHAQVGEGGQLGTMKSPYDPLFFIHHANVDRKYAQWVEANPTGLSQYPNPNQVFNLGMLFRNYTVTVSEIWNTTALCYTYGTSVEPDLDTSNTNSRSSFRAAIIAQKLGGYDPNEYKLPSEYTDKFTPIDYREGSDKLHYSPPLPEKYIQQNYLNKTEVRHLEFKLNSVIDYFNSIEGYLSPCSRQIALNTKGYIKMSPEEEKKIESFISTLLEGIRKAVKLIKNFMEDNEEIINDVMDKFKKELPDVDWDHLGKP